MKYIRTKNDNIYEVIEERDTKLCIGVTWEENIYIDKKDVLKQADTIEELCDEFVVIATNWKEWHEQYISLDKALYFLKEYDYEINKNAVIYGAIWTDKGLIYVAKMNEKGELELL